MKLFQPVPNQLACSKSAFDVVAIAASAGGMQAISCILAALPHAFPAAILVQTHLSPHHDSVLADILQLQSRLPVRWAAPNHTIQPGTVTVSPPGQHVRVTPAGQFSLTSWELLEHRKPTADGLFASVATSFGERAVGVVLTGYLSDGARGVQAINAHGGRVLAQEPASAEVADMPSAAIATGCVDFVLPLRALAAALITLTMVPGAAQLFAVPTAHADQPYRHALQMWSA